MDDSRKMRIFSVPPKTSKIAEESAGKLLYQRISSQKSNKVAMLEVKTGLAITYGDLASRSINLAANLQRSLNIAKNDILAIVSENSHKFLVAFLAGIYLAAPVHLLNPGYTIYELKNFLMLSMPKLVFCSKQTVPKIKSLRNECPFIDYIILFDNDDDYEVILYENLVKECENFVFEIEKVDDLEEQVAYIANSSGTTGLPKGTMITHANMRLNFSHCEDKELYDFKDNSVLLHVIPFYHIHGCGLCYCTIYRGIKLVAMDQFDPKIYLENVQNHKADKLFIVPTLGNFLANTPLVGSYDLSSVGEIYSAAGNLGKDTTEKLLKRFNLKTIRQVYGLTEIGCGVFLVPAGVTKPLTCGKVTPGHSVKIVDTKTHELLGYNQPGEIYVKGANMKGYINNPEQTRAAVDSDGFIRTGDIGYYDEDNFFFIIDRLKDLIKYKGFQVAPMEIEDILVKHGGVKEAAVVGKPDERYGELAVAFVVKEEGVEVKEREIEEFVAKFVCVEKRLHGGVKFVGELPRNGIGKVLRKDLRALL